MCVQIDRGLFFRSLKVNFASSLGLFARSLRVRNLSIIAHVDHGKTSLSDCLLRHAGQLSIKRQGALELDNLQEEKERGITIQVSCRLRFF